MNWLLIALLSIPGLLMGLLSTRGHTRGIEPFLWIILGVFAALVIARTAGSRYFLHGLSVGVAWGVLNGATAAVLFASYARHNPEMMQRFSDGGLSPRLLYPLMGVPIGLVTGLVLGAMCWGAATVVKPAPPVSPASQAPPPLASEPA